jgi:site-specific DNA-methyltransferase (adenine-specific)
MEFLDNIICGDVLEVMAEIPENTVHLAITSPPYNLSINYDSYKDDLAYEEYLDWTKKVWLETKRVLESGGRFALNIAPTSIKNFRPIHHDFANQLREIGMIFRTEIVWYKQTMKRRTAWGSWRSPANPHIVPSWEYILVFSKDSWTIESDSKDADITTDEFMRFSDGFWYIPPESQRRGHPTPFPEELIYRLIKFYTYKGNVVLDMFGGTGTVAVVAQKTGRHFIHIDISPKYCEIAKQRLETARMLQEFPVSAGRTGKRVKVSELFSPRIKKRAYDQKKRGEIPEVQLLEPKKAYKRKKARGA